MRIKSAQIVWECGRLGCHWPKYTVISRSILSPLLVITRSADMVNIASGTFCRVSLHPALNWGNKLTINCGPLGGGGADKSELKVIGF